MEPLPKPAIQYSSKCEDPRIKLAEVVGPSLPFEDVKIWKTVVQEQERDSRTRLDRDNALSSVFLLDLSPQHFSAKGNLLVY